MLQLGHPLPCCCAHMLQMHQGTAVPSICQTCVGTPACWLAAGAKRLQPGLRDVGKQLPPWPSYRGLLHCWTLHVTYGLCMAASGVLVQSASHAVDHTHQSTHLIFG
jgi:hypothetical protein